jgi:hypothetical protein
MANNRRKQQVFSYCPPLKTAYKEGLIDGGGGGGVSYGYDGTLSTATADQPVTFDPSKINPQDPAIAPGNIFSDLAGNDFVVQTGGTTATYKAESHTDPDAAHKSTDFVTPITSSNKGLTEADKTPAANNGVLTIKQGGTTKGTFSADSATNVEVDLDAGGGGGGGTPQIDVQDKYLVNVPANSTYNIAWSGTDSQDGNVSPWSNDAMTASPTLPVSFTTSSSGVQINNTGSGATDTPFYVLFYAINQTTEAYAFRGVTFGTIPALNQGALHIGNADGQPGTYPDIYTLTDDDKAWISTEEAAGYTFMGIMIYPTNDPTAGMPAGIKRWYIPNASNITTVFTTMPDALGGLKDDINIKIVKDANNLSTGWELHDKNDNVVESVDWRHSFANNYLYQMTNSPDDVIPIAAGATFYNMAFYGNPTGTEDWTINFTGGINLNFTAVGSILTINGGNMRVSPDDGSNSQQFNGQVYSSAGGWEDTAVPTYYSYYHFLWIDPNEIVSVVGDPYAGGANKWYRFVNLRTVQHVTQYMADNNDMLLSYIGHLDTSSTAVGGTSYSTSLLTYPDGYTVENGDVFNDLYGRAFEVTDPSVGKCTYLPDFEKSNPYTWPIGSKAIMWQDGSKSLRGEFTTTEVIPIYGTGQLDLVTGVDYSSVHITESHVHADDGDSEVAQIHMNGSGVNAAFAPLMGSVPTGSIIKWYVTFAEEE